MRSTQMLHIDRLSRGLLVLSLLGITLAFNAVYRQQGGSRPFAPETTSITLAAHQATNADAPAATLLLNADQLAIAVGSQSTLTLHVRDAASRPVANQSVALQSTLGSVTPANVTTNGEGMTTVTFTAGTFPGQATVTATSGTLHQEAAIQVVKPNDNAANRVTLDLNTTQIARGQSIQVQIQLRDANGAPLAGELLSFFGALGEVSPASALTDSTGRVTFTYRAGQINGLAQITVLAGSATDSTTIQVGEPAEPSPVNRLFLPLINR